MAAKGRHVEHWFVLRGAEMKRFIEGRSVIL